MGPNPFLTRIWLTSKISKIKTLKTTKPAKAGFVVFIGFGLGTL